jgi:hypothetical protein
MELFICWSGTTSSAVGNALYRWIPRVIQAVKPWMSEHDIDKGSHWKELDYKLEKAKFGLICITPDNQNNPWLLYEAGSLSKSLKGRTWTFLFRLEPSDISGPLTRFQHTITEKNDFKRLINSINNMLANSGELSIDKTIIDEQFDKWWPELRNDLNSIEAPPNRATNSERSENKRIEAPEKDHDNEQIQKLKELALESIHGDIKQNTIDTLAAFGEKSMLAITEIINSTNDSQLKNYGLYKIKIIKEGV